MSWRDWSRIKKIFVVLALSLVALAVLGGGVTWFLTRPEPADTRFNGAYRLEDGRLVVVTARAGETLRYRMMDGESRALYPVGPGDEDAEPRFEAGAGWSEREPVALEVAFEMGADDRATGFHWIPRGADGDPEQTARRIDLPEEVFTFSSGDLSLRGKLVLPVGAGPHPAVVLVHGSESYSAVDHYADPYLYAAHGLATLAFDKRGTGDSEGSYSQNFEVLAGDVVSAVETLRSRPEIDPGRIHLEGGSQGGWIAPLAAARLEESGQGEAVRSLLINYGPMVPIAEEDRWGHVYQLRSKGFGPEAIRKADALHERMNGVFREEEGAWDELGAALEEAEGEEWFEAVKGSDSAVGFLADSGMPLWVMRLYAWWRLQPVDGEPFALRFYDPVPAMEGLDVPSLWIFGGEDDSMPTQWSVDELVRLQQKGRPIEILLYPEADHGILRFEEGEDGGRIYLGYEPTYLPAQVRWLRHHSGLEERLELPGP